MATNDEYNIPIWDGTAGLISGSTPFGIYDDDVQFQLDGPKVANYSAQHLGFPLVDVELQSGSFYAAFEEAISKYSELINLGSAKDNLIYLQGASTGSDLTQRNISQNLSKLIEVATEYGSEVGSGGNIEWYTGSISITRGQQDYNLYDMFFSSSVGEDVELKRVFYNAPPASKRIFDPMLESGVGSQNLFSEFGFEGSSASTSYMLLPMYHDLLRMQAVEFNDQIRKSGYAFEIIKDRLRLFPIPVRDFTLQFEYIKKADRSNPLKGQSSQADKIADISNTPYGFIPYSRITSTGRTWIWDYAAASAMTRLGWVRTKYSSIPIPNAEVSLNGDTLLANGEQWKDKLIEQLKKDLDETSRTEMLRKQKEESEYLQDQLAKIPFAKIYIG